MSMNSDKRVVVTGLGIVSSIGSGVDKFWNNLVAGKSGITTISQFDASDLRCRVAGEISDFQITDYISPKEAKRLDKFCHYAYGAAREAISEAGLDCDSSDPERIAVLVGSGIGGISTLEKQAQVLRERGPAKSSPLMVPMLIADMASGYISITHGFKGPNHCVVTACASGAHAIGEAMWLIRRGDADAVVTGGAEACLSRLGVNGFCAMRALTGRNHDPAHASRPFDADRDGFVPSEGAGIMILESLEHARARNAEIHGEIIGYGSSGDAYHITAPDPSGDGASRAIQAAMRQARLNPENLDYINAHGTSTPLNDKVETMAIKRTLGRNIPVSSSKSMTGHTLGAAGGLESTAAILAFKHGVLPPTINYEKPDPDCDLDYVPNTAREAKVETSMNINLGFGGHNAVLIFRKM